MSNWFDETKENIQKNATEDKSVKRSEKDEKFIGVFASAVRVTANYMLKNSNEIAEAIYEESRKAKEEEI